MGSTGKGDGKGKKKGSGSGQGGLLAPLLALAAFVAVALGALRDRQSGAGSSPGRAPVRAAPRPLPDPTPANTERGRVGKLLGRVDHWQRARTVPGFLFAVVKKFGDDRAGYLAALVSYYAFFSVFPLLLALTSILGFVLQNNESLRQRIEESATEQIPIIGPTLGVGGVTGSIPAIVVGVALAIWSGLRVIDAAQNALNDVWDIPLSGRPNIVKRRLRGVLLLGVIGLSLIGSLVASGLGSLLPDLPVFGRVGIWALTLAVNFGVFLLAFKLLSERDDTWAELVPGSIFAAVGWLLLQTVGAVYIQRTIEKAGDTYNSFASVIGLLTFFFLASQLVILAAEINVVRARRLWPRSLQPGGVDLTAADRSALTDAAQSVRKVPTQHVDVVFDATPR